MDKDNIFNSHSFKEQVNSLTEELELHAERICRQDPIKYIAGSFIGREITFAEFMHQLHVVVQNYCLELNDGDSIVDNNGAQVYAINLALMCCKILSNIFICALSSTLLEKESKE